MFLVHRNHCGVEHETDQWHPKEPRRDDRQNVRRQHIWNQERRNLREYLAHLVDGLVRRVYGDASAAVRTSFA